jgi:hypothetical protein
MLPLHILAQQPSPGGPTAATIFYITLLFIFLTAIVTAFVTKWSRDKCLKYFHRYHVTLERNRGQTIWGRLKVFSSGIEFLYDHPYVNPDGIRKTSFMIYQQELDQQRTAILRYHDELLEDEQARRQRQVEATFNPGPFRRFWRRIRNLINTLRDAFNAAIGTAVGQFQRVAPGSALTAQAGHVTQIGQTLLGRFANAYEPLLEQYIGQPVILEIADPIDPNNRVIEYAGFLAEYTQHFIAVFNVSHGTGAQIELALPDAEQADQLPPLPPPPPPGAPPPVLPEPMLMHEKMAVRMDGRRFRIQNTRRQPVVVRRLQREQFEPVELGVIIPPNAALDLPARDARGATLIIDVVRCLDIVAARRNATVRHAGELVERRGLIDELAFDQLPLIPRIPRLLKRSED